jgi:sugar lactone lactonase YvrE
MRRAAVRCRLARALAVLLAVGLGGAGVTTAAGAATPSTAPVPTLYVGDAGATSPFVVGFGAGANGDVTPLARFGGSLKRASGLARDAAGTIWVADSSANTVTGFAVGSDGIPRQISTVAGTHTQLAAPTGLAFDPAGHLWVANQGSSMITEYAPRASGNAAPIATLGGPATEIARPVGIAFDAFGNLLVADGSVTVDGSSTLEHFRPGASGNVQPLNVQATLGSPLGGVAINPAGQIDVTVPGLNMVQTLGAEIEGTIRRVIGPATGLASPTGVALDSAGHLWVANSGNATVTEYAADASGNAAPIATIGGKETTLNRPQALLVLSPPGATTSADLGVSQRAAAIAGSVVPGGEPTTYHFELGLTTAYGTTTPDRLATGPLAQLVRATVSLPSGVTEHYRLVASNDLGTTFGADRVLTTVSAADGPLPSVYVLSQMPDPNSVTELGSVSVYAPGSRGDMPPVRKIAGPDTQLVFPRGIAVDPAGDLFVAALGSLLTPSSVLEFAPGANGDARPIAVITDTGGSLTNNGATTNYLDPGGIAADAAGHLLVSNFVAGSLIEYARVNGAWAIASRIIGLGSSPGAVAFGAQGQKFAFDEQNSRALGFASGATGNAAPIANLTFGHGFLGIASMATDPAGDVIVANPTHDSVVRRGAAVLGGGSVTTQLSVASPVAVAVDASGRDLVATGVNEVKMFAAGAVGSPSPLSVLSGAATGLDNPLGIAVSPLQLAITTSSLPDAAVGQPYATTLTAGGATPPYYWTSPSLPPGLVLNPLNGQLSGTPTRSGPFKITITATDATKPNPPSATMTLFLTITPPIVRSVYVTDGARGTLSEFPLGLSGNITPLSTFGQANGLLAPTGVAVDASGRVYVANSQSNAITELAPFAGLGATPDRTISGADTGLVSPDAVTLGPDGEVYVANAPSQAITVYAAGASGDATPVRTIAGPDTGLDAPAGVTVNAAGDLWVANQSGETLTEYAPTANGDAVPIATVQSPAFLHGPTGIGQDPAGHLLVTNRYGAAVDRFAADANGITVPLSTIQGPDTGLAFPHGIDVDDQGSIYVANENGPSITVYAAGATNDAQPLATITGPDTGLASPEGLAVAPPLSIRTRTLPVATVGHVYRATLRAALGTTPYVWHQAHGRLPAGLRLTREGMITGVPRVRGVRRVRVRVTDSSPHRMIDTRQLTLHVTCPRGRFGARCTHGPPGTRQLDLRLTVGRCTAARRCGIRLEVGELAVRTGPLGGVLLQGRASIASGHVTIGKRGPARLVLHAHHRPPFGVYRLRLRSRGHTILTLALLPGIR